MCDVIRYNQYLKGFKQTYFAFKVQFQGPRGSPDGRGHHGVFRETLQTQDPSQPALQLLAVRVNDFFLADTIYMHIISLFLYLLVIVHELFISRVHHSWRRLWP